MLELAVLSATLLATPLSVNVIDATTAGVAQLEAATQLDAGLPEPPSLAELIRAQTAPETLQGFDTVVLTQINASFGSENLPLANGGSLEPGIYVTVSPQEAMIFDEKIMDLQDGVVPPGPASRECKSGCKASLWSPFRNVWLRALEEAQTYVLEVPSRVLFGAEASVPAKTLVELAYAAAETRPGQPPSFSLLVNGSNAGLRARPFYLMPPGGMRVSPGDNALGLRVTIGAGETFTISAAHPRFSPNIEGVGWKELAKQLVAVKKRYPNKGTIIIDVGDDATVGDVVMVMVASQKQFPTVVLTDALPVRWG
ncbi:hypothetical protein ENSA5_52520 [Enhygromyxa salina]|uniref:Uncharacterized protein n=1 Tax=Enhygromyxa salina TaxID=215803 RepID=A0A2S9XG28_9BACT|nr:hypothetical protein [Enhygromyxa salina]PRP91815.1 hypothetical protein ENSA5_52520 [Enhygromyxa salina]